MGIGFPSYDDVTFVMPPRKRIALSAQESQTGALLAWARHNADPLSLHDVAAPTAIAAALEEALDLPVTPLTGGDPVVGPLSALVGDAAVDVLIVFCDPDAPFAAAPRLAELFRRAVEWNVPFACNVATADFLVASPLMLEDYVRQTPDLTELRRPMA